MQLNTVTATFDPRAANCRAYAEDGTGKVTGVNLAVLPYPGPYRCTLVQLIDEEQARGMTTTRVFVRDAAGNDIFEPVWLAWPWDGNSTTFANRAIPGNTNYPVEHVTASAYAPAAYANGPLAIYVGNAAGGIQSDVVCGLGLPNRHHVSYHIIFTAGVPDDDGGGGDDGGDDGDGTFDFAAELLTTLQDLDATLNRMNATLREGWRLD